RSRSRTPTTTWSDAWRTLRADPEVVADQLHAVVVHMRVRLHVIVVLELEPQGLLAAADLGPVDVSHLLVPERVPRKLEGVWCPRLVQSRNPELLQHLRVGVAYLDAGVASCGDEWRAPAQQQGEG